MPSSAKAIASPCFAQHCPRFSMAFARSRHYPGARALVFCAAPPAIQYGVRAARVLSRRKFLSSTFCSQGEPKHAQFPGHRPSMGLGFKARHRPRFSTAFARSRHCPGAVLQPREKGPYGPFFSWRSCLSTGQCLDRPARPYSIAAQNQEVILVGCVIAVPTTTAQAPASMASFAS